MNIPDGWKLVPVEPTKKMRGAFHRANDKIEDGNALANVTGSPDYQWAAMLKAAPKPPRAAIGAADPLDTPLPCEVSVPGMRFGKGVSLRTFVQAATRWKTLAAMVPLADVAAMESRADLEAAR